MEALNLGISVHFLMELLKPVTFILPRGMMSKPATRSRPVLDRLLRNQVAFAMFCPSYGS